MGFGGIVYASQSYFHKKTDLSTNNIPTFEKRQDDQQSEDTQPEDKKLSSSARNKNIFASLINCLGSDNKYSKVTQNDCDFVKGFWDSHKPSSGNSGSSSGGSSSSSTTSSTNPTSTPAPTPTPSCSYTSYDTTIYNDNPVAFWELDDSGSTVLDCSSNKAHNGSYVNNPTTTTLPNGDTAAVFNGSTQYVETVDADDLSVPTTGKLTVEAWMRPDILEFPNDEGSGYVHWMGKGETNQHEYVSRIYSLTNDESRPNRISGYSFNLAGGLGVGSYFQDSVVAGEWIHYVLAINTVDTSVSYPTGYTKIYKNGSLRDQDSLSSLSIVPGNGTAPFRIGTRDLSSYFQGAIGKVAIYDAELTNQQVLNHYQAMIPPVPGTASLVKNVGSATSQTSGNTLSITVPSAISAGNTVIVKVLHDYTAGGPTVIDSRGNTYTRDRTAPSTGNIMRASIFSSPITTPLQTGDTITITTSVSITTRMAAADEFTGLLTSSYIDQQNGSTGNSTTPGTTISITTTQANELIIGMVGVNTSLSDTYTEDTLNQWSSLTRTGTDSGSGDKSLNSAYKTVGSTDTYQYHPTLENSANWVEFIVSYKASGI